MASRKIQAYQNKANNLCIIYIVFDLDGECKFIKTKHCVVFYWDVYMYDVWCL